MSDKFESDLTSEERDAKEAEASTDREDTKMGVAEEMSSPDGGYNYLKGSYRCVLNCADIYFIVNN